LSILRVCIASQGEKKEGKRWGKKKHEARTFNLTRRRAHSGKEGGGGKHEHSREKATLANLDNSGGGGGDQENKKKRGEAFRTNLQE